MELKKEVNPEDIDLIMKNGIMTPPPKANINSKIEKSVPTPS